MVNSKKPGYFVIGSEGSADKDGSNTCLLGAAGVKNTLCEAIVISSNGKRRFKLGSAYFSI